MNAFTTPSGFGLIIIGSEILDGRRTDKHFDAARAVLTERSIPLRYVMIIPDDPVLIDGQLRWAMARPEPFFCCGGIGSTPDDYTRDCAARAAGVPLAYHPEGVVILKSRFGKDATPGRLKMVLFPQDATLIPNPINQVPGFTIRNGHFLPGFPEMARPMMAWVLKAWYAQGEKRMSRALLCPGAREGDLVGLMEAFVAAHPMLNFSSLPRFTATGTETLLGLEGSPDDVERGLHDLKARLEEARVEHVDA